MVNISVRVITILMGPSIRHVKCGCAGPAMGKMRMRLRMLTVTRITLNSRISALYRHTYYHSSGVTLKSAINAYSTVDRYQAPLQAGRL